jgi:hypothetical protein
MVIGKKVRYLIYSTLVSILLFFVSGAEGELKPVGSAVVLAVALLGAYFTQLPNNKHALLSVLLLPFHLVVGASLTLHFFPNLSLPITVLAIVFLGIVLYSVSLVNNIFLVVGRRGKSMPLYRVGITWSQILLIIIAIPYFAGVFKIPVNSITQNFIAGVSAFFFSSYILWTQSFDPESKAVELREKLAISSMVMFATVAGGLGVSFFPTESFLRSLYVSSILMSSIGYLQAHYKNLITRKMIMEYLLIITTFLIIVIAFSP